MFFETWWQGIMFGMVTTVAMLVMMYFLADMWKKYEGVKKDIKGNSVQSD